MSERFKVEMVEEEKYGEPVEVLKVTHDGKLLYEERDGGEPEDQSFCRDWAWVPGAIRQAYALGLADGSTLPNGDPQEVK